MNTQDFLVTTAYTSDRNGNYELRNIITDKWEFCTNRNRETNGNICGEIYYNLSEQCFEYSNGRRLYIHENYCPFYRIMSPALLMYRLVCTFFEPPFCGDWYKKVWDYPLLHKETNIFISFSEWKGGIYFAMTEYDYSKLPDSFKSDLFNLLAYLFGNECAHPYDGLVAGGVA